MKRQQPALWDLYRQMLRSRRFEEAARRLWDDGKISGEMHLGLGEEAIAAGIRVHLEEGDAVALDHRGTPMAVMLGIDLVSLLREFLGHPDGLCHGMGGHMHLFSREHLFASSGIVGAAGPAAAGFALAAQMLRPGKISVAFFGDGAINQGMLMESFNLAQVWSLPVLFVCRDNGWAITTQSKEVTGGTIAGRAQGFGLHVEKANGTDVEDVAKQAGKLIASIRKGKGPAFLWATCACLEGHFLGDALVQVAESPMKQMRELAPGLLRAATRSGGGSLAERASGLGKVTSTVARAAIRHRGGRGDPVAICRKRLVKDLERLEAVESEVESEIHSAVEAACQT